MDGADLYDVLQLKARGPQVQNRVIRQAYHKQALALHPDKRGNDPIAAAEFQKLQEAYEILNDDKKRATYDMQQVRKTRLQKDISECGKKMKVASDFKTRNGTCPRARKPKTEEQIGELNAWLGNFVKSFRMASGISSEYDTTIKASWMCKEEGARDYSEIQLKEIFKEYGEVIEAVKSRKKSFAIVVMGSKDAAVNHIFCTTKSLFIVLNGIKAL